jgi:hypothetical protein
MIELTAPLARPHKIQDLASFFSTQNTTKVVEDKFLFGLQDEKGLKYIVLRESLNSLTWGWAPIQDLVDQDLCIDESARGLREFLDARILEDGFKVFTFELSQTKEYLLWLSE